MNKKPNMIVEQVDEDDETDSFVSAADSPSHQQRLI